MRYLPRRINHRLKIRINKSKMMYEINIEINHRKNIIKYCLARKFIEHLFPGKMRSEVAKLFPLPSKFKLVFIIIIISRAYTLPENFIQKYMRYRNVPSDSRLIFKTSLRIKKVAQWEIKFLNNAKSKSFNQLIAILFNLLRFTIKSSALALIV